MGELQAFFDGGRLVAGVNGQPGVQRNDITGGASDVIECLHQQRRRLFAVGDLDAAVRYHAHAEVFRMDLIFAHLPVLEFADQGGGSQRAFIHAVLTVDDQHVTGPQPLQDAHLYADQIGVEDAHELVGGIGRVGQRAQDVEDGPHPQFFAHGSDVLHGTVVGGGEHEANTDLFNAFGHLPGRQIDVH